MVFTDIIGKCWQVLRSAAIPVCIAIWTLALSTIWKDEGVFFVLGVGAAIVAGVWAWWKKVGWIQLRPLLILSSIYGLLLFARFSHGNFFPTDGLLRDLFGSSSGRGFIDTLFFVGLCYTLAYALSAGILVQLKNRQWFRIAVIFSIALSLEAGILMLFEYWSFRAPVYDFGIFDQALYQLSQFEIPVSTTRQVLNLWSDHQHFSIALLAPVYWLGPAASSVLILLTPFLLITLPALLLVFCARSLERLLSANVRVGHYAWVLGLSSYLLWLHPYTQSALGFYFHEKYLMPVAFTGLLLTALRAIEKPTAIRISLSLLLTLIWLGVKEDQWLFVMLFWLHFAFGAWFFLRKHWRRVLLISGIGLMLCSFYAFLLLPKAQQDLGASRQYTSLYEPSLRAWQTFTQDGNIGQLIRSWGLLEEVNIYLSHNALLFDAPGLAAFPLNIAANYAERIFSSEYSQRNPIFHYGVDVPIYASVGILTLIAILKRKKNISLLQSSIFFVVLYSIGFGSILGWNSVSYLHPRVIKITSHYLDTSQLRHEYGQIDRMLPDNASIVSTDFVATHLTKRDQIAQFPDPLHIPDGTPGKNDLSSYEYWILRLDKPIEIERIELLRQSGYLTQYEGKTLVLLQRPE